MADLLVDSAGTADYHVDSPPDRRAVAHGERRGLKMKHLRGRQVSRDDFDRFDVILAMDEDNLANLQRIRPAVLWLQEHIGLRQALASERLQTDGAEVLWDFGRQSGDLAAVEGLVVVRSGQQVFRPVVRDYLSRVTYKDGWTRVIQLPQFRQVDVVVDPWLNGGQPTVAERGIRVDDIVNRLKARETAQDVADDYDLTVREVEAIREAA